MFIDRLTIVELLQDVIEGCKPINTSDLSAFLQWFQSYYKLQWPEINSGDYRKLFRQLALLLELGLSLYIKSTGFPKISHFDMIADREICIRQGYIMRLKRMKSWICSTAQMTRHRRWLSYNASSIHFHRFLHLIPMYKSVYRITDDQSCISFNMFHSELISKDGPIRSNPLSMLVPMFPAVAVPEVTRLNNLNMC